MGDILSSPCLVDRIVVVPCWDVGVNLIVIKKPSRYCEGFLFICLIVVLFVAFLVLLIASWVCVLWV